MRYALDILAILTVVPKVQLVLADTVNVLDETRSLVSTVGQSSSLVFLSVLSAADWLLSSFVLDVSLLQV